MIDIDNIVQRNYTELSRLLSTYEIKYSIEQLVKKMKTIYVNDDRENQRLRLLGVEKQFATTEDIDIKTGQSHTLEFEIPRAVKKAQIYVMKKREYEPLNENERNYVIGDLNAIISLISELQTIKEIEEYEENWAAPIFTLHLSEDFFTSSLLSN
jgi:hypothetical protein